MDKAVWKPSTSAMETLCKVGHEVVEQFYEPDELSAVLCYAMNVTPPAKADTIHQKTAAPVGTASGKIKVDTHKSGCLLFHIC